MTLFNKRDRAVQQIAVAMPGHLLLCCYPPEEEGEIENPLISREVVVAWALVAWAEDQDGDVDMTVEPVTYDTVGWPSGPGHHSYAYALLHPDGSVAERADLVHETEADWVAHVCKRRQQQKAAT